MVIENKLTSPIEDGGVNGLNDKEYRTIFDKGIQLLAMREHSVLELTEKLSKKHESIDLVYVVIDELLELNYVCDERFTEAYVRSRQNKGFGPIKIRHELTKKGIKNNMIDDHIQVNSAVWFDNAEHQYKKKAVGQPISDYNTWSKYARFLQNRGFTMEQIHVTLPPVSDID